MTTFQTIGTKSLQKVRNLRLSCPSCGFASDIKILRPYCSEVCRILAERGFGWRLDPYRIIDLASGVVLNTGPQFDLTRKGLDDLQSKAEHLRQSATPSVDVQFAGPMASQTHEQSPQPTFAGASAS